MIWFGVAHASSVGIGVGPSVDLPDKIESAAPTVIGPGPTIVVPVRLSLPAGASLRLAFHAAYGHGADVVSFQLPTQGRVAHPVSQEPRPDYAYADPDEWAKFLSLGLVVGPEVRLLPEAAVTPTLGVGVGGSLVHTFHNLDLADLMDRQQITIEDLQDRRTIDPYSRQLALTTDVTAGVMAGPLWAELGYNVQFVGAAGLRKTAPSIEALREPYRWNAARLVVGMAFPIGPQPAGPETK